jgi:hypothetical protein
MLADISKKINGSVVPFAVVQWVYTGQCSDFMNIVGRLKVTGYALSMLGFGAGALFGDLVPIAGDQVYDGSSSEERWSLLDANASEGYSISNGVTLTIQNYTRVGSYYAEGAIGPLPEVEFGGGSLYLDLGSTFVSGPVSEGGTGKILFQSNRSQADSGGADAFGGAVFGRTGSSLQITNGAFSGNTACGAAGGTGSGKGGAIYS